MTAGFLRAFLERAEREPDRAAFVLYSEPGSPALTNGALRGGALRWAALLRDAGVEPDAVVLLSLPLGRALLEAFLGALVVGAVPSMMPVPTPKQDPALFWSSHDRLFTRLRAPLIVTTPANAAAVATHVRGVAMRVTTPAEAETYPAGEGVEPAPRGGDAVACLQHSSGTTGLKKGVALTFDAIDAQLDALGRVLGTGTGDTIVSWLPLYHDMGFVACLLQPLSTGMPCVLLETFAWLVDPLSFLEAVARHRGTLAWLPNFAFAHLANAAFDDARRVDLSSLRAVIDCSEACRPETLAGFAARFADWGLRRDALQTSYAMAETVFAVTQSVGVPRTLDVDRAALEAGRAVPAAQGGVALVGSGVALPGVALQVLGASGEPLPPAQVGEIAVAAPFLFTGYHLEPERTAAALRDGFYLTGDLGFLLDDELFVLGRRDDLLILLGRNVYANEVESLLADVPGVKPGRVLAMGLEDPSLGSQELVVLVEPLAGADEKAVRAEVRHRLESVLAITPRRIAFVPAGWLVKSTSGKIGRAENRRKFLALQDGGQRRSA